MFWYLSSHRRMQACTRASATMITELCTRQNEIVRQNTGKIYPNLEIHTEVYILIVLCSAEARVIISTGST